MSHTVDSKDSRRGLGTALGGWVLLACMALLTSCMGLPGGLLAIFDDDNKPFLRRGISAPGASKPSFPHMPALLDPDSVDAGFAGHSGGAVLPLRPTDENLKVAFIGDQGLGGDGLLVLELIRDEGADFVIHGGDFDYLNDPAAWDAQIDAVLGDDYPYFVSIGNHDLSAWSGAGGYQERMQARLSRVEDAQCAGDLGVNSSCRYRGLFFVLSGVGTLGENHEAYLHAALSHDRSIFRVCSWHKNQHDMQVGSKTDEVGWGAYQICQQQGALIINGHEHSYARTLNLTAVGNALVGHGAVGEPAKLLLEPGMTAVIVSGLGGESHRPFTSDHEGDTWWASIYALDLQMKNGLTAGVEPTIESGALFIEFNVDGDPDHAHGYFKTIGQHIVDEFDLDRTVVDP